MSSPTAAAEWVKTVPLDCPHSEARELSVCYECAAANLDAYARQQVERYALTVDDPTSMHLHYDGCPFKSYADKCDVDIPDPRPECTCAEAHKAAYWKGQWSLEQTAGRLKVRQRVEAIRNAKLPCGHPSFYMEGQGACAFCYEITQRVEAFREVLSLGQAYAKKGGEHEGECNSCPYDNCVPCELHLEASATRRDAFLAALRVLAP